MSGVRCGSISPIFPGGLADFAGVLGWWEGGWIGGWLAPGEGVRDVNGWVFKKKMGELVGLGLEGKYQLPRDSGGSQR